MWKDVFVFIYLCISPIIVILINLIEITSVPIHFSPCCLPARSPVQEVCGGNDKV